VNGLARVSRLLQQTGIEIGALATHARATSQAAFL